MVEQERAQGAKVPGRRRSAQAHQAILQATKEKLEEVGHHDMTIEAIVSKACVGKKTIYRWWSSKAALVLEVLTTSPKMQVPFPDTGSLEEGDLLTYFEQAFAGLQGRTGAALSGLAAEAQLNLEFAHEFQRVFIIPRKEELVIFLQRGVQRGELAPATNLEVLADLIYGAKWYRLLLILRR